MPVKKKPAKFAEKASVSHIVGKSRLDLVLPDFARYFLILAVIVVLGLFVWVISPFFTILIYAGLIAVVFYPLHKMLLSLMRGKNGLAAFISTLLVSVLILVPLILFTIFIGQEAVATYGVIENKIVAMDLGSKNFDGLEDVPYVGETLNVWVSKYGFDKFVNEADIDFFGMVQNIAQSASTFIFDQGANFVKSIGNTIVSLFILVLTVFFFFRDGEKLKDFLKRMSPLPHHYEDEIENKLRDTTYGIVAGNFGTALLQGVAGGIGFAIAGIEHAVFWGAIMAFSALIPYVGASLLWFPASIYLFFNGQILWAIFLLLWGILVVATVDNVARPFLIGGRTKMHPLATFLVVLGGIFIFGLKGVILGPLVLTLAVTIIHIYQFEYKEVL